MPPGAVVITGDFSFPRGGAPTARMLNLAMGLAEIGCRVHLLPMGSYAGEVARSTALVDFAPGITYSPSPLTGTQPVPRAQASLLGRLRWMNRTYRQSWQVTRRFRRARTAPPDALICYGRSYLRLAGIIRAAKARGVVTLWDNTESIERFAGWGGRCNPLYWDWRLGLGRLPRLVDGVMAISRSLRDAYERAGCRHVMLLPLLLGWPADAPADAAGDGPFRLMYIGSLSEKDAPEVLLEAFRRVRGQSGRIRLQVVGGYESDPIGRRHWQQVIHDPDFAGRVDFLGWAPPEELREKLKAASALVLLRRNSLAEVNSFPTRLGELLQSGRPVITTSLGDIPFYLQDGREAVLVPPDSPAALARAIENLAESPDRGRAIGLAGWACGRRHFDRLENARRACGFIDSIRGRHDLPANSRIGGAETT